jgi:ABC-type nitrate/sulfonate/bicarbonate transport system permease component
VSAERTLSMRVLGAVSSLIIGAALWQLAWFVTGGLGFSSLSNTLSQLAQLVQSTVFWMSLGDTVFLTAVGLFLGLILALLVGVGIGGSPLLDKTTRGTLNFLRSIPSIILLPLFMASMGSFFAMVIYLVAAVVAFKLVVFVIRGVRDADAGLRDSTKILGLNRLERVFFLFVPSAAILVTTGLRLSATRAYGTVVLAGVLAGTPGIGAQIGLARLSSDPAPILAYALVAGVIGVVFFSVFSAIERFAAHWVVSR